MSHRGRSRLVVLATALTIAALVPCGRAAAADKKPGEAPGPTPAPAGPPPDFNPSSAPPADTSLFAGQLSRKFKINKDNPEGSVPNDKLKNENPLEFGYFLQDLITLAELARRQKDYVGAVKYYRAVVVAAPDNAAGWSKLCEAYSLFGDPVKAAGTCRQAIERPGAEVNDFKRYVENTL